MRHHQFCIARTAGGCASVDRDDNGQRNLNLLHATVDDAADERLTVFHFQNFLGVCHLVEAELLGHLRTHLGGVAVDGLPAADDDVHIANLLDGRGQRIRGGQRVGTGKQAVGEQPARIGTAIQSLTDNLAGTRRTHREESYGRALVLLLQSECLLKGVQVFGIEDGGQSGAVDGALGGHRVLAHVAGVWHLLGQHYNFQSHIIYI